PPRGPDCLRSSRAVRSAPAIVEGRPTYLRAGATLLPDLFLTLRAAWPDPGRLVSTPAVAQWNRAQTRDAFARSHHSSGIPLPSSLTSCSRARRSNRFSPIDHLFGAPFSPARTPNGPRLSSIPVPVIRVAKSRERSSGRLPLRSLLIPRHEPLVPAPDCSIPKSPNRAPQVCPAKYLSSRRFLRYSQGSSEYPRARVCRGRVPVGSWGRA